MRIGTISRGVDIRSLDTLSIAVSRALGDTFADDPGRAVGHLWDALDQIDEDSSPRFEEYGASWRFDGSSRHGHFHPRERLVLLIHEIIDQLFAARVSLHDAERSQVPHIPMTEACSAIWYAASLMQRATGLVDVTVFA